MDTHDYKDTLSSGWDSDRIEVGLGEDNSSGIASERPQGPAADPEKAESIRVPAEEREQLGATVEKAALQTPEAVAAHTSSSIPDGGFQAWLQVLGSWVIMVETFGLVNTFGVFQTYYETDLLLNKTGGSATQIAWIGSLQVALLLICGIFGGPLYDAGYFSYLISSGLFLVVFGLFMTSLCTEYWQIILAQGITMGIGMGLCFTPSNAILSQYFHKKRPLVLGISSCGSPLAGIIFPIMFSRLEPRIGFGWATRIIAFILLALAVVPILCMRPRVPPSHRRRALIDTSAFKEFSFVAMLIGSFCGFMCIFVPFFFVQLFGERRGIENESTFSPFYLVTMLNLGSFFGRLLPNTMAVRYGSINLIIVCTGVSAILLFGWMGITSVSADAAMLGNGSSHLGGTIVFALLYGLFSGGVVGLIPSVIISLTKDMSRVGTRMGMSFLFTGIACLIGPPIAGSILGNGYSNTRWMGMIGFGAASVTLATIGYSTTRYGVWRQNKNMIA